MILNKKIYIALSVFLVIGSAVVIYVLRPKPTSVSKPVFPELNKIGLPPADSTSISAKYSYYMQKECSDGTILYTKDLNVYSKKTICLGKITSNVNIPKQEFQEGVYFDNAKNTYTQIRKSEVPTKIALHKDTKNCYKSQNENGVFICTNENNVIVESLSIYETTKNYKLSLLEFNEQKNQNYCNEYKTRMVEYIKAYDFCQTSADCKLSFIGCPFECTVYLNQKADSQKLTDFYFEYVRECNSCMNNCATYQNETDVSCINNKCVKLR